MGFEEMDRSESGVLTMQDFEDRLKDERVVAYFNAMMLDVGDAQTLFMLLDFDNSGEIVIDEFLAGCWKLQGQSRALDLAIMQMQISYLKEVVGRIAESVLPAPPVAFHTLRSRMKFGSQIK